LFKVWYLRLGLLNGPLQILKIIGDIIEVVAPRFHQGWLKAIDI